MIIYVYIINHNIMSEAKLFFKKYFLNILIGFISGAFAAILVVLLAANSGIFNSQGKLTNYFLPESEVTLEKTPETLSSQTEKEFAAQEYLVVNVVKKANPAVVSIVITKDIPIIEKYYEESPGISDPFQDFFGGNFFSPFQFQVPKYREKGTEKKEVGGGSGFLVSQDGMIITNKHVVSDEKAEYTVFTNDGKKYDAKVIARDPVNDIAVLRIEGKKFPYLELGDSDKLQVGQTVIAIGNALAEFRNTVSVGVISGLSRSVTAGDGAGQMEQLEGVIQTDAAINPGNSGGPLLNSSGKVIGVNVAMARGSENIGFSLPINTIKSVITSVKENGKIVRPYLGVRYTLINQSIKEKNNLSVDYGALVARGETKEDLAVMPGSPADKAGIIENDIILEVDGAKVNEEKTLSSLIRNKNVGDSISLKILHKGEEKTVNVKLEEMPN